MTRKPRLTHRVRTLGARIRRLFTDRSAVAYIEFAYSMPVVLLMGLYGIEATNYALVHQKISQMALTIADNSSRVGEDSALSLVQFRESDVNDTFAAARQQAGNLDVLGRGRIILSSLEQNGEGGQWVHWQRCIGEKNYNSTYGVEGDGETGTDFVGMGKAGEELRAPAGNAVMFVEITYDYEPIMSDLLLGEPQIHYTAAFLVRDERDLSQIYNPSPIATVANCDTYSS